MENQIDGKVIRMITKKGFLELFWEEYNKQQKDNPKITRKEVFDKLNEHYASVIGEFRYRDYNTWRQTLTREKNN